MNFIRNVLITTLSIGTFSAVNASDLNNLIKIKNGLYASLDSEGKLTEIATNTQTIFEMKMDETDELSQSIRHLLTQKDSQNLKGSQQVSACNYPFLQFEQPTTNGNSFSLTASTYLAIFGGPIPPLPKFMLVRTKAKMKGYDTAGNYALKSFSIDRFHYENLSLTPDENSLETSQFINPFTTTTAEINTSNLSRVYWVARTDIVVDNPLNNQNNFPASAAGDCYQTISVKVSNNIYY